MPTSSLAKSNSLGHSLVAGVAILLAISTAACSSSTTPASSNGSNAAEDTSPADDENGADASTPPTSNPTPDGGKPTVDPPTAGCEAGVTVLKLGQKIVLSSTQNGNAPRDYCFELPTSASITVKLTGGTCNNGSCIGDDVELYLKSGAMPDPFDPDASTKAWTYTPASGGFGNFGKAGTAGAWYLSIIDGQNTLGYKNVSLTVTAQ